MQNICTNEVLKPFCTSRFLLKVYFNYFDSNMDDNEYYKMMRDQYSHRFSVKKNKNFSFTEWNAHQGREDAEMLQEKESGWKADKNFDEDSEEN